jgi:hypothetical protein
MFLFVLFGVGAIGYFYRRKLLFFTLGLVINFFRFCVQAKKLVRGYQKPRHGMVLQASRSLNSKVNVHFCKLQLEDMHYNLKVVTAKYKNAQSNNVIHAHVLKNLNKCNKIVFCCLMDSNDGMLELTTIFREFVFHFDKDNDESRLGYFLEFVCHQFNIPVSHISDMDFVVYMNDDTFTEHRFPASEVLSGGRVFKDILALNTVVC